VSARNYRDLEIWKKGIGLAEKIYEITDSFPKREFYSLTSQMRRSAISIPSNIAEGFVRKHALEFKRFLSIAIGSLAELETQIELAARVRYLEGIRRSELLDKCNHLSRMLNKFYKRIYVKK
jgi:four helix bundle protein